MKTENNNTKIIREVFKERLKFCKNTCFIQGRATGFYNLDYVTMGLQKGNLILLAGR